MKTERVIWGLIFLFIGGVLLLDNFGLINFHWSVIWHFWPVALILLGVNMLFPGDDSPKGGIISVIITIAALVFIGYQGTRPGKHHEIQFKYEDDWDNNDEDQNDPRAKNLSVPISEDAKYAVLNIEGGATKYHLSDTTFELLSAEVKERGGRYSLFKTSRDSVENLDFKMKGKHKFNTPHTGAGKAEIKLNTKPIWDINVEVGAGKVDFDLSAFKVKNINIEGGAASFNLKLGFPQKLTTINTDTGVSKLDISIPASAACEIHTDTGLSSNDFDGFVKKDDSFYVTPEQNYLTAKEKFVININGGISKVNVRRY